MLIIDSNQLFITSMTLAKDVFDENEAKIVMINSLRDNVKKFKQYGEVVVASDSRSYWRKDAFPYYKASRKSSREKSPLDWDLIFKALAVVKSDIENHFPYKFVEEEGAEADDIIGTLVPRYCNNEQVMIISSDGDFVQLQKYGNVRQYNPMTGTYVTAPDPNKALKEKIIRGDRGDGIPSILSEDNVFVIGKRQSRLLTDKVNDWLDMPPEEFCNETMLNHYKRNQKLIDFDYIPQELKERIITRHENAKKTTKQDLYKYFVKEKMVSFIECLNDF